MTQVYLQLDEVGILHRTNEITVPKWRQDGVYKLIVGVNGGITFDTRAGAVTVLRNEFLLLNPEDKHQQIGCDGDKFLLEFSRDWVNEVTREVMGSSHADVEFSPQTYADNQIVRLVAGLLPELHEQRAGQQLVLEHITAQMLILAVRNMKTQQRDGKTSEKTVDRLGVDRVVEMMMDCFRDPLSLEDMANTAHLSKFTFIRQFRSKMGVTPYEWLQRYRTKQVAQALRSSHEKVLEIALHHGFASVSALNRQFRRLYGMTPSEWRQLHQHSKSDGNEYDANAGNIKEMIQGDEL